MSRWGRFAGVGAMGLAVQLVSLHALTALVGLREPVAVAWAVEIAVLHNFLWHEQWTWRDRRSTTAAETFARLVGFNLTTGLVSIGGNVLLTGLFAQVLSLPVLLANLLAISTLTLVNFLVADRLTFVAPPVAMAAPSRHVRGRRSGVLVATLALVALAGDRPRAATLTPETIAAWDRYVVGVEDRLAREAGDATRLLAADFGDARQARALRARLARGEIVIENVAGRLVDAGDGTISHWRGHVFVPGATVDDLLEAAAMRGPRAARLPADVLDARVLARDGRTMRLFLKLRRDAIISVTYNTEHLVRWARLGADRAVSRSVSTRIAELRDAGSARERERAAGDDRGFMWRLHAYWRYQAVPGGVIVELESLTLSRDVPWTLRAVTGPLIDRIARESIRGTLQALVL